MSCEYHNICLNSAICRHCKNMDKLKLPKERKKKKRTYKAKPGMKLEKKVAKQYDKMARRTINSGAVWFDAGDIDTEMLLMDTKDTATVDASGKETFTIERKQLEKIIGEALAKGKFPCLPFKYKDGDRVFAVMDFNDILALVQYIQQIRGG